jgi:hypothetical protein
MSAVSELFAGAIPKGDRRAGQTRLGIREQPDLELPGRRELALEVIEPVRVLERDDDVREEGAHQVGLVGTGHVSLSEGDLEDAEQRIAGDERRQDHCALPSIV